MKIDVENSKKDAFKEWTDVWVVRWPISCYALEIELKKGGSHGNQMFFVVAI